MLTKLLACPPDLLASVVRRMLLDPGPESAFCRIAAGFLPCLETLRKMKCVREGGHTHTHTHTNTHTHTTPHTYTHTHLSDTCLYTCVRAGTRVFSHLSMMYLCRSAKAYTVP